MAPGSRRSSRVTTRPMPIIVEDDDGIAPPNIPARSNRRLALGYPYGGSFPSFGTSPPLTRSSDSGSWPDRKPELQAKGFKDQAWIVKRGGWYRVSFIALLILTVVVGLSIGLALGLRKNKGPYITTALFPIGSWSFTTALRNVSTACTSNPGTFRCYPYSTYDPSTPDASSATYHWIIAAKNKHQYMISSSENPFAPEFSNITLTILNRNTYRERFTFNFTMAMPVVALSGTFNDTSTTTCYFNSTVLSATIWTRMRADYPRNISSVALPVNASSTFDPWPFAVDIAETQPAGADVPACRDWQGRAVGDVSAGDGGGACSCSYSNYDTLTTNGTASRA